MASFFFSLRLFLSAGLKNVECPLKRVVAQPSNSRVTGTIASINARSRQPSTRSLFVKLAKTYKTYRPQFVDDAHAPNFG